MLVSKARSVLATKQELYDCLIDIGFDHDMALGWADYYKPGGELQHAIRQRTEAADATRTHETVDTEGDQETTGIHTDNNNKRETTTTTTTKETKENSSTV